MQQQEEKFKATGGKLESYKLEDIFTASNGNFDIQQKHINGIGDYVISSGVQNLGIIGKTDVEAKIFPSNTITVDMFGNVYYRDFPYKMVTHARVFSLSFKNKQVSSRAALFISSCMQFLNQKFSYSDMASWEKIKKQGIAIYLPTKNNQIDFDYMEERIRVLEEERIRVLEEERIRVLESYLKVSGLTDCNLAKEEEKILHSIQHGNIKFKEFKLEDILNWQPQKEIDPLKIKELTVIGKNKYPFYGQATISNGIISYECLKSEVLNNTLSLPTILIHSNNQNCVYLETPFYLKDGHGATSVLQNKNLNELNAQFLISCIKKVIIARFSYDEKATKIALKNTYIQLPVSDNNQIDYAFMETYIRAIEKKVIKNVIDWKDAVIAKTKEVITQ